MLGTIDRPSVHDLVLDFAMAQQDANGDVQKKHRLVVESIRQARPVDVHGRRKFVTSMSDDPLSLYVCNEVGFHLKKGWQVEMEQDALAMTGWLGDVPQDEIVIAAGVVLGLDRLSAAAHLAERDNDMWLAGRYWSVVSIIVHRTQSISDTVEPICMSLDAIDRVLEPSGTGPKGGMPLAVLDSAYEVQLGRLFAMQMVCDPELIAVRTGAIDHVLTTNAAARDPMTAVLLSFLSVAIPTLFNGDMTVFVQQTQKANTLLRAAMVTNPDSEMRYNCAMQAFGREHVSDGVLHEEREKFDWDAEYGVGASKLAEIARRYDYDTAHNRMIEQFVS